MKTFTEQQINEIRSRLKPHLAEGKAEDDTVDHPFCTLRSLLNPRSLSTREGIRALSNTLYRCCGITLSTAANVNAQ